MRMIVAALTSIFIALYFMYFAIPLLATEHTNFNLLVNSSDPVIAQSYTFGSGLYQALPLIPLLIAGFVLFSVALKRDPGE